MLLLTIALSLSLSVDSPTTVLAGTGAAGDSGDGGPATAARLREPFDVAYSPAGELHFSDTGNHKIRKIDRAGNIATVAGIGVKGFAGDGGPASEASLNEPYGIVFDPSGNLYFADRLNRRVRRIDAKTGIITTVAGDGSKATSGDGGPATKAGLVEPNDVALDRTGRLLIADVAGHRVRALDLASGRIATFAGDGRAHHAGDSGPAERASIHGARAVAVSPDGTVWILEREGNTLRAVDPATGLIATRAGNGKKGYAGDGGPALDATFNGPKELCLDAGGNVYVVDTENHAIRRIDAATGRIATVIGDGKPGSFEGKTERLNRPHGVAISPTGSIVVGDTNNHQIRAVNAP